MHEALSSTNIQRECSALHQVRFASSVQRRVVLTGQIRSISKLNQNLQSQDTDNSDESTDAEHEHDQKLLALVQVHIPQHRHRQTEHDNIQDNVEGRGSPPLSIYIVAATHGFTMPTRPGVRDGPALEDGYQDKSNAIAYVQANDSKHDHPKPS